MFLENQKHLVLTEFFLGKGHRANLHILVHTPSTPRKSTWGGWNNQQLLQRRLRFFFLIGKSDTVCKPLQIKGSETFFLRDGKGKKTIGRKVEINTSLRDYLPWFLLDARRGSDDLKVCFHFKILNKIHL